MTTYNKELTITLNNTTFVVTSVQFNTQKQPICCIIKSINNKIVRYRYYNLKHKYPFCWVDQKRVPYSIDTYDQIIDSLTAEYLRLIILDTILEG